jgi:ABC-type Na+ efflux pump permease subunit
MDKIRKREFTGSIGLLVLLFLSIIGIPVAIVYLIDATVETEYEVDDAEAFWRSYKRQHPLFGHQSRNSND